MRDALEEALKEDQPYIECQACSGDGTDDGISKCRTCNGRGKVKNKLYED